MDQKDEDNSQQMEDGSEAIGKILVKLKLPKTPPEEEVKSIAPPPESEIKSHYCKECGRSFSCGKALGGHMSSAHVQGNKDHSSKKLKTKNLGLRSSGEYICQQCGKIFRSNKSLFGHMRCHPERDWRGMDPPLSSSKKIEDSSESSGLSQHQEQSDNYNHIESIPNVVSPLMVLDSLTAWPRAAKRARGAKPPADQVGVDHATAELLLMLGYGEPMKKTAEDSSSTSAGDHLKKQKEIDYSSSVPKLKICDPQLETVDSTTLEMDSSVRKLKICERDHATSEALGLRRKMEVNGKGKDKISVRAPDNNTASYTSHDEICLKAMIDGKRVKEANDSQGKGNSEEGKSSEKYQCGVCGRIFGSHQALGGHRSSHNKVKFSVYNTMDHIQKPPVNGDNAATSHAQHSAADTVCKTPSESKISAPKLVLDIDLNASPQDEDDQGSIQ